MKRNYSTKLVEYLKSHALRHPEEYGKLKSIALTELTSSSDIKTLSDKVKDDIDKALFYVHQTVENGWSRSILLNFISTDLYERQGKALTNFTKTLPDAMSDLAQELTKDPYNFAFTGITGRYNERLLKNALLNNITRFLMELNYIARFITQSIR